MESSSNPSEVTPPTGEEVCAFSFSFYNTQTALIVCVGHLTLYSGGVVFHLPLVRVLCVITSSAVGCGGLVAQLVQAPEAFSGCV